MYCILKTEHVCASYSSYWVGCCVSLCNVLGMHDMDFFQLIQINDNYFSLLIPIKEHIFCIFKRSSKPVFYGHLRIRNIEFLWNYIYKKYMFGSLVCPARLYPGAAVMRATTACFTSLSSSSLSGLWGGGKSKTLKLHTVCSTTIMNCVDAVHVKSMKGWF